MIQAGMRMCHLLGFFSNLWTPVGLILDVVGVLLLGFDLVRVQRSLRTQARNDLARFEAMVEDYGGTEKWVEFISQNTRWVTEREYFADHEEDEVSLNTRHTVDQLAELAQSVSALAQPLTKLILFQKEQAEANSRIANASILYSIVGLVLIFVGFVMQFIAAMHWLNC
jgi:ABC-type multidrug transport system fused ATPase/permease subunit